jgi:methanethiol S-methyltransferase
MITSAILIFLAVAVYGLVHSLLASIPVKALVQRLFGEPGRRFYRLVYNAFAGVTFLPLLALTAALPGKTLYRLPLPWSLLALGVQFLALLALALAVLQTGALSFLGLRAFSGPADTGVSQLVTSGLYRFVRHPIYTAGLLFIWASPVMTSNLLALYLGVTIYIFVGAQHEEYRLVREFGDTYREYQRRTPMLIPFLRLRA